MGGTYTLAEDETLSGDLVIAGGNATLETGSTVQGDILALGGSLRADGLVEGDILAMGGQVYLGENASVTGSVNMLGGSLERMPGSLIEGDESFSLPAPMLPGLPDNLALPEMNLGINPIWKLFWVLMRSFLWAALAVLVTLFLPVSTRKVSQVITGQPIIAGGLGCLTVMVAPIILFIIGITIIGIPISLLAALILLTGWCFGIIAAGVEVGRRLASAFRQEWALPVSAAVGAFLLTIVTNSVDAVVPCVGWVLSFLVGLVRIGCSDPDTLRYQSISIPGRGIRNHDNRAAKFAATGGRTIIRGKEYNSAIGSRNAAGRQGRCANLSALSHSKPGRLSDYSYFRFLYVRMYQSP